MDEKYTFALRKIALLGGMSDNIVVSSKEFGDVLGMSQQSASKRILKLLDLGLIVRELGTRKQHIKITQEGIVELKKEYNEYRRIFEFTDYMTVHGIIEDGMGKGRYYICQKGYMDQFEEKLGFKPYFGTLNVAVDEEDVGKLGVIKGSAGIVINGFTDNECSFGDVIAYKAKIRNIDCAIVVPAKSHYVNIIEIVCQYHLKRTLSIESGDRIDVRVSLQNQLIE